MNDIVLQAGERYILSDGDNFLRIGSGSVEVYAATREKSAFRQALVMLCTDGAAIFPALDEFQELQIVVYAVTEVRLTEQAWDETEPASMRSAMTEWLARLAELPWLKLMADRGDAELQRWRTRQILDAYAVKPADFAAAFRKQAAIFSMLQGMRFHSEDKKAERRLSLRERQQERLRREAVGALLSEAVILQVEDEAAQVSSAAGEVTFIVRTVLKALDMPHQGISLPADAVKKLTAHELLCRLAQKGNMGLRPVTLSPDWHTTATGVFIGCLVTGDGQKLMAALVPDSARNYLLVTKENPAGVPLTAELAMGLRKKAFQCYGGLPRRALTTGDLWRFMASRGRPEDYRTIFLTGLVAGLIPLLTPIITETIFRDILPVVDYRELVTVTQVLVVAGFTMTTISTIRSVALTRIALRLNMDTEAAFILRLLSLPEKFFRRFESGELASRVRSLEKVQVLSGDNRAAAAFNLPFSLWSVALMCWYSPALTLAALAVWLVWCVATAVIQRQIVAVRKKYIAAKNKRISMVQQIFSGLAKFRLHGAEEQAYNLWSRFFGDSMRYKFALRCYDNYSNIIDTVQPFALAIIIYCVAFYVYDANNLGYAEFLAFVTAYTAFNATLSDALPALSGWVTLKPHIDNLQPLLTEVPEQRADKIEAEPLTGAVEISHLTFAYGEDQPDILRDLSFSVAPGENLAIVGRSGCGKSTLVRLLLGFEQPKTGAIYYDGHGLADLSLPSVRAQMGVVLQNGQLMTGDIFTNIAGQIPITQEDAWEAAEAAGIADDIRAMPMGMQTIINEGGNNISGGQRQRLMIARALALKPSILIFDEATSALDNKSQAIVTNSLNKLRLTRIIIAHRLSTVKNCDRILVLDKGQIAESGTFAELMDKGGIFAELVKRQRT